MAAPGAAPARTSAPVRPSAPPPPSVPPRTPSSDSIGPAARPAATTSSTTSSTLTDAERKAVDEVLQALIPLVDAPKAALLRSAATKLKGGAGAAATRSPSSAGQPAAPAAKPAAAPAPAAAKPAAPAKPMVIITPPPPDLVIPAAPAPAAKGGIPPPDDSDAPVMEAEPVVEAAPAPAAAPRSSMAVTVTPLPPLTFPPLLPGEVPEGVDADFAAELAYWHDRLATTDYFEILHIPRNSGPSEVKKAYFRGSRTFHPDRFFNHQDEEFRARIDRVYKRINEAYVVLRDDRKRAKYLADVAGPERETKLRFTEESEAEVKNAARKEKEEETGKTPQGRKFFEQGMQSLAAGKPVDAHRAFKMALTFESGNELFKARLAEATAALPKTDFKIR